MLLVASEPDSFGNTRISKSLHEKLRSKMDTFTSKDYGHGRTEIRTAYTTDDVSWQPGGRERPGLKCIGAIQTHFESKNGTSEEWHYYISSRI